MRALVEAKLIMAQLSGTRSADDAIKSIFRGNDIKPKSSIETVKNMALRLAIWRIRAALIGTALNKTSSELWDRFHEWCKAYDPDASFIEAAKRAELLLHHPKTARPDDALTIIRSIGTGEVPRDDKLGKDGTRQVLQRLIRATTQLLRSQGREQEAAECISIWEANGKHLLAMTGDPGDQARKDHTEVPLFRKVTQT